MDVGLTSAQIRVLRVLVEKLQSAGFRFEISGGLAAKIYGSPRPLYDIDLEIAKGDSDAVRALFQTFIVHDWYHCTDGRIDCQLLTLEIDGVPVDISQVEGTAMTTPNGQRIAFEPDLSKAVPVTVHDLSVPVEAKDELLAYKRIIHRPEDLADKDSHFPADELI